MNTQKALSWLRVPIFRSRAKVAHFPEERAFLQGIRQFHHRIREERNPNRPDRQLLSAPGLSSPRFPDFPRLCLLQSGENRRQRDRKDSLVAGCWRFPAGAGRLKFVPSALTRPSE